MKLTKPIKGILFDIDGTLNCASSESWMFHDKLEKFVDLDCIYHIPMNRFSKAYETCRNYLSNNHSVTNLEEEYEKFLTFYTMLSDLLPEFGLDETRIKHLAYNKVYDFSTDAFFNDVKDTLDKLKENHRLGILADAWPSDKEILKQAGISKYFSCMALSCMYGGCMPNKTMFENALSGLGTSAAETILIDNSHQNLAEAKKYGIQPVWMNTKSKKYDSNFLTIHSLSEILEYV